MGLNTAYLRFIESSIERAFGPKSNGLRMLELGDQVISDPTISDATGKDYFSKRGFAHTSVDLNGRHGALVRDLTRPEQFRSWHGSWDIVTNSGTTEHVEPFESQYECFEIIHDCLAVGGIAIHLIPDVDERDTHGAWKNHCRYYYSEGFFSLLETLCPYELLANTVINGLRCATVRKTAALPFMADRVRLLNEISQRDPVIDQRSSYREFLSGIGVGRLLRRIGLR